MSLIGDHPERDYFFETLRLKVMTFDTCQGEERDLVFYSMVASPTSDKLWAIFVKDLALEDLEENGKIKAQRLNVGFSRAKECMHFVLSKPIEDFRGAIGEALRHYSLIGNAANDVPSEDDVDSRSPMEKKVLQWILRTQFYRENAESMVVRAQFPIGETLRQLDPLYQHPQYKVDFLIVVTRPDAETCRMVLEYDGFEFHFREHEFVTDLNYDQYYSEDDVERQLILESYGYRFIRLNRFNCGQDPVAFLDSQIAKHVKKKALARQIS